MFELVSCQLPVQVFLIQEIVNADLRFRVTAEKLSCLLDGLKESQTAARALSGVITVLGEEFLAKLLHDLVVHVTAAQVAIGAMADDAGFLLLEASNRHCRLRMTKVDESNNPLLLLRQVALPEEAVVVADGRALVDNSEALESGDFSGVDEGLPFRIRRVGGNGQHDVLSCDLVLHVEIVELLEVEGDDLLNRENVGVASLLNFKCNFIVLHGHHFMGDVPLLKLELRRALAVEAEEAGGEQDTVLEVTLDRCLDRVTDDSLLLLVGDANTAKLTR